MHIKRWNLAPLDTALAAELSEACEINPFLSLLLTTRGLDTPEQIFSYLAGQEEEVDPFDFADMDKAVARVRLALDKSEKILVYGDYDVDGVTATALLYTYLKDKGAAVSYHLPNREEGYGLHDEAIRDAAAQGVTLLLTVDNGVTAVEEVALAAELGIDTVVTDHHQPKDELPRAVAVVDPHRADCPSECKDFAGVGMAFMLACALEGDAESVLTKYGDLLTLGTLADVIPLRGFNRDLMRRGLMLLNASNRPGLLALRDIAGQTDKELSATSAVFLLVPRLNAAGRMDTPDTALRLLLAENSKEAASLAEELQQLNARRQTVGNDILMRADSLLRENPAWLHQRVLVLAGEGWHPGLLGIVAARLVERYGKPALVLSLGEDGVAHGSGRSLTGFNLYQALNACQTHLTRFGGHELAAGVTLPSQGVDGLRQALNDYAAAAYPRMPSPTLEVALRLRPEQITVEKLALLEALEPFGADNPSPLFGLFRMKLDNITAIGGGKHLRLSLSRDGVRLNAVKFQTTPEELPISCGSLVNCIVSLEKNVYMGNLSVGIHIKDISFADTDREFLAEQLAQFEGVLRQECCPVDGLPKRELLARLYSLLKACGQWCGTAEQLQHALCRDEEQHVSVLPILVALELWRQSGLVSVEDLGERMRLTLLPVSGKTDLSQTPLWQYLERGETDGTP